MVLPLVLLPPLGLGERYWNPVRGALEATAPDTVVHDAADGRSETVSGATDALLQALDTRGFDTVDLAGAGWGGAFALHVAQTHPDRVRRLALISTAPDTGASFADLVVRIALISTVFADYLPHKPVLGLPDHAALVREKGMVAEADAVFRSAFIPGREGAFADEIQALRRRLSAVDPEVYASLCESMAATDVLGRLPSVRADTLVLAANDDWSVPPGTSRVAALGIPSANRVVVRDSAAFLLHPDPGLVGGLLVDHFTTDRTATGRAT